MRFFEYLETMQKQYQGDCITRNNGTLLLGIDQIPRCRHMLFEPLSDEYIETYLISQYVNRFPEEYIAFLKYTNGANLYNVRINMKKHKFAHSLFVIFGLPRTVPSTRPSDMEEPFDMRIEDLARHPEIPMEWLKCGTYNKNHDMRIQYDIFIDTTTNSVFSCEKNKEEVVDRWDTLDDCFCNLFESFFSYEYEYEYKSRYS